jgi:hypothetical protein
MIKNVGGGETQPTPNADPEYPNTSGTAARLNFSTICKYSCARPQRRGAAAGLTFFIICKYIGG